MPNKLLFPEFAGMFQERLVPWFYFDVREEAKFVPDEEGLGFTASTPNARPSPLRSDL
jgi:hypothetical protein